MNKTLRSFFDHTRPRETLDEVRKPLLITMTMSVAAVILVAPPPLIASCLMLLTISLLLNGLGLRPPLLISYGVGVLVLVALKGILPGRFGAEFTASIFVVMALCQSWRLKTYRDGQLLLIWLLSSNVAALLLDDSATLSVWILLLMFVNFAQLLRLHLKVFSAETLFTSLRSAARTALYALPMLLIFVYTFEKSAANRALYGYSTSHVSGISDNLEPGQVSTLTMRNEVAYRIVTNRPIPPFTDLYWRAFTLSRSRGLAWGQSLEDIHGEARRAPGAPGGCLVAQTIYAQQPEARNMNVALDVPLSSVVTGGNSIEAISAVCPEKIQWGINESEETSLLNVEDEITERVRALGEKFKVGHPTPPETADRILAWFKKEKFSYTLNPGAKGPVLNLDRFLFDRREGYCEHFAAAAASLMRLAGVPSRVVVGYQGGTYNTFGHFWVLNYSDAHAWFEYWDGKAWTRVDPVAVIAPIELRGHPLAKGSFLRRLKIPAVDNIMLALDALFFRVQNLFSGREKLLALSDFTMDPWLAIVSLAFLLFVFKLKESWQPLEAQLRLNFNRFCDIFGSKGVKRGRSEGVESFRKRALAWMLDHPKAEPYVGEVSDLFMSYANYRFGARPMTKQDISNLSKRVLRATGRLKKAI